MGILPPKGPPTGDAMTLCDKAAWCHNQITNYWNKQVQNHRLLYMITIHQSIPVWSSFIELYVESSLFWWVVASQWFRPQNRAFGTFAAPPSQVRACVLCRSETSWNMIVWGNLWAKYRCLPLSISAMKQKSTCRGVVGPGLVDLIEKYNVYGYPIITSHIIPLFHQNTNRHSGELVRMVQTPLPWIWHHTINLCTSWVLAVVLSQQNV